MKLIELLVQLKEEINLDNVSSYKKENKPTKKKNPEHKQEGTLIGSNKKDYKGYSVNT